MLRHIFIFVHYGQPFGNSPRMTPRIYTRKPKRDRPLGRNRTRACWSICNRRCRGRFPSHATPSCRETGDAADDRPVRDSQGTALLSGPDPLSHCPSTRLAMPLPPGRRPPSRTVKSPEQGCVAPHCPAICHGVRVPNADSRTDISMVTHREVHECIRSRPPISLPVNSVGHAPSTGSTSTQPYGEIT